MPVPVALLAWPDGDEPVVVPPGVLAPLAAPDLSLMVLLATSQHWPWGFAASLEDDPLGAILDCAAAIDMPPASNAVAESIVSLPSMINPFAVGLLATSPTRTNPRRKGLFLTEADP